MHSYQAACVWASQPTKLRNPRVNTNLLCNKGSKAPHLNPTMQAFLGSGKEHGSGGSKAAFLVGRRVFEGNVQGLQAALGRLSSPIATVNASNPWNT